MFTLVPIRGDFTIDDWIKKEAIRCQSFAKGSGEGSVNLYPRKAEIIFPTLQIDDRVAEYLRETILNYYL